MGNALAVAGVSFQAVTVAITGPFDGLVAEREAYGLDTLGRLTHQSLIKVFGQPLRGDGRPGQQAESLARAAHFQGVGGLGTDT